eukprot:1911352-Prorocentrum_lima.AAC.1
MSVVVVVGVMSLFVGLGSGAVVTDVEVVGVRNILVGIGIPLVGLLIAVLTMCTSPLLFAMSRSAVCEV